MQTGHDGASWYRQSVRDFFVAHLLNIREYYYFLIMLRQTLECAEHFLFHDFAGSRRLDGCCLSNLLVGICDQAQPTCISATFAEQVVHDLDQPSATVRSFLETMERAQGFDERLLHQVFRLRLIPQQPFG